MSWSARSSGVIAGDDGARRAGARYRSYREDAGVTRAEAARRVTRLPRALPRVSVAAGVMLPKPRSGQSPLPGHAAAPANRGNHSCSADCTRRLRKKPGWLRSDDIGGSRGLRSLVERSVA